MLSPGQHLVVPTQIENLCIAVNLYSVAIFTQVLL